MKRVNAAHEAGLVLLLDQPAEEPKKPRGRPRRNPPSFQPNFDPARNHLPANGIHMDGGGVNPISASQPPAPPPATALSSLEAKLKRLVGQRADVLDDSAQAEVLDDLIAAVDAEIGATKKVNGLTGP